MIPIRAGGPVVHPVSSDGYAGVLRDREAEAERRMREAGPLDYFDSCSDARLGLLASQHRQREARLAELIRTHLEEGLDYYFAPGSTRPIPKVGAAEKFERLFRISTHPAGAPAFSGNREVFIASLRVAVHDLTGVNVFSIARACSSAEPRFLVDAANPAAGFRYADARECANELLAIAGNRARIAGVLHVCGAKRLFDNADQYETEGAR